MVAIDEGLAEDEYPPSALLDHLSKMDPDPTSADGPRNESPVDPAPVPPPTTVPPTVPPTPPDPSLN